MTFNVIAVDVRAPTELPIVIGGRKQFAVRELDTVLASTEPPIVIGGRIGLLVAGVVWLGVLQRSRRS